MIRSTTRQACLTSVWFSIGFLFSYGLNRFIFSFFRDLNSEFSGRILLKKCYDLDLGNRTVILSTLTEGYVKFIPTWLKYNKNVTLSNGRSVVSQFLILAFDKKAFHGCQQYGLNCWLDESESSMVGSKDSINGKEMIYSTEGFNRLMWRRMEVMYWILKQGFSILFSDMDIIWLKDPFPLFDDSDFQAGIDYTSLNAGFWLLRNSNRTLKFFHSWTFGDVCRLSGDDQGRLATMIGIETKFQKEFGLKINALSPHKVRLGCVNPNGTEKETYNFHPTCVKGIEAKLKMISDFLVKYNAR